MSIVQTEAVLLKKFRFGDTSVIANFFSRDFGKFTAVIKGARNFKSGKSGIYQSMNRMMLIFNKKENRELQTINKADLFDSYEGIKSSLDKLNIGFRIMDLTSRLFIEFDKNVETYSLLTDVLKKLELCKEGFKNYLLYFQLKISDFTGISVFGNNNFGRQDVNFFLKDETFVNFSTLKNVDENLYILSKINFSNLENVGQFCINDNIADYLIDYLDGYLLQDNYSKELKSSRIINQMKKFKLI